MGTNEDKIGLPGDSALRYDLPRAAQNDIRFRLPAGLPQSVRSTLDLRGRRFLRTFE